MPQIVIIRGSGYRVGVSIMKTHAQRLAST